MFVCKFLISFGFYIAYDSVD